MIDNVLPEYCERCVEGPPDNWVKLGDPENPVLKRYVCDECREWFEEEFSDE